MAVAYTLAYCNKATITTVESFIAYTPTIYVCHKQAFPAWLIVLGKTGAYPGVAPENWASSNKVGWKGLPATSIEC